MVAQANDGRSGYRRQLDGSGVRRAGGAGRAGGARRTGGVGCAGGVEGARRGGRAGIEVGADPPQHIEVFAVRRAHRCAKCLSDITFSAGAFDACDHALQRTQRLVGEPVAESEKEAHSGVAVAENVRVQFCVTSMVRSRFTSMRA